MPGLSFSLQFSTCAQGVKSVGNYHKVELLADQLFHLLLVSP